MSAWTVTAIIDRDPEPHRTVMTVHASHIRLALDIAQRALELENPLKRDAEGRLYRRPEIIAAVREETNRTATS